MLNLTGLSTIIYAQDTWIQKADLGGTTRFEAVGFSIGTKGYILSGDVTTGIYYKDLWEYDPSTNVWTQKQDFPGTARVLATGFSIGSKGYFGTGYDLSGTYHKDFWEYDPAANTWTRKENFAGAARYEAVGFSIGPFGFIGTGYNGSGTYYKDFFMYEPTFVSVADLNNNTGIKIYPNPASDDLFVELSRAATVEIINAKGQIILTKTLSGIKDHIDLSALPPGVYTVKVRSDRGINVKKLIKQ